MNVSTFKLRRSDAGRVAELSRLSFRDAWSQRLCSRELTQSWAIGIGPLNGDGSPSSIDGVIVCGASQGDLHVALVAVDPQQRGLGLGRRLLEVALRDFEAMGGGLASLEVRASNEAAISLYQSMHFQVVGFRLGYYRKYDEDAYVMARMVQPRRGDGA